MMSICESSPDKEIPSLRPDDKVILCILFWLFEFVGVCLIACFVIFNPLLTKSVLMN